MLECFKCWNSLIEATFDYTGMVGRPRFYHASERAGASQNPLEFTLAASEIKLGITNPNEIVCIVDLILVRNGIFRFKKVESPYEVHGVYVLTTNQSRR